MSGLIFAAMDDEEIAEFDKKKASLRTEISCIKADAMKLSTEFLTMTDEWTKFSPEIKTLDHPAVTMLREVFLVWSLANDRFHSTYLAIDGVVNNINRALAALSRDANDFTQDPFHEVTELNADDGAGPLETAHMHMATAVVAMEGLNERFKTYHRLLNQVRSDSFAWLQEARRVGN